MFFQEVDFVVDDESEPSAHSVGELLNPLRTSDAERPRINFVLALIKPGS